MDSIFLYQLNNLLAKKLLVGLHSTQNCLYFSTYFVLMYIEHCHECKQFENTETPTTSLIQ